MLPLVVPESKFLRVEHLPVSFVNVTNSSKFYWKYGG